MKKHILFIVQNNSVPGDVRVWKEALAAKEYGYDVSVICPVSREATAGKYEKLNGINIYRHSMPLEGRRSGGFIFEYFWSLIWETVLSLKLYFTKPFHVIHGANPPDHLFLIALLFRVAGVKYVFDHHDIAPETYVAKFGSKNAVYKILKWMEKATFSTASIVISTNESYKRIALTRGGKKEESVFIVRNGPDLSAINRPTPNVALREGFDYLVAYLGMINNQEGIDHLLRSIKYIVYDKRILGIKFVVVGRGAHWQEMVRLSNELKLEKWVNFTGYIPYEELYEILATADLCVNPEFRNEFTDKSTMIKIMDYMTFGKPIVMFETSEGKITAGESAHYVQNNDEVEFAEAIVELLKNKKRRQEMGKVGKERIRKLWDWEIQKRQLHKAYKYLEGN
jgi:glycosyltransferase involved in cell wall biosynthesis